MAGGSGWSEKDLKALSDKPGFDGDGDESDPAGDDENDDDRTSMAGELAKKAEELSQSGGNAKVLTTRITDVLKVTDAMKSNLECESMGKKLKNDIKKELLSTLAKLSECAGGLKKALATKKMTNEKAKVVLWDSVKAINLGKQLSRKFWKCHACGCKSCFRWYCVNKKCYRNKNPSTSAKAKNKAKSDKSKSGPATFPEPEPQAEPYPFPPPPAGEPLEVGEPFAPPIGELGAFPPLPPPPGPPPAHTASAPAEEVLAVPAEEVLAPPAEAVLAAPAEEVSAPPAEEVSEAPPAEEVSLADTAHECRICFCTPTPPVITTVCGHAPFCKVCLLTSALTHGQTDCPVCRHPFPNGWLADVMLYT